MPRLFIALPVPEDIGKALVVLQAGVPDARWVPPQNFHVTLCFAGDDHLKGIAAFNERAR